MRCLEKLDCPTGMAGVCTNGFPDFLTCRVEFGPSKSCEYILWTVRVKCVRQLNIQLFPVVNQFGVWCSTCNLFFYLLLFVIICGLISAIRAVEAK